MTIRGQIGRSQDILVKISYDGDSFTEIGTIEGDGSYVAQGQSFVVGSPQIGEAEVGGGGSGVYAYDYVREFRVRSPRFDKAKIRFESTGAGYASVSEINYQDIKLYGQKNVLRFRQTE